MASVNRGDYCLAKAALGMSNQLWSVRLAEYGIPVYEVRPGVIKTDMTAGVTGKYDALIASGLVPQNRWGLPEDVGTAVAIVGARRPPLFHRSGADGGRRHDLAAVVRNPSRGFLISGVLCESGS